ncbi:MAG TPA: amidohydrolase [Bacillota bacterium]
MTADSKEKLKVRVVEAIDARRDLLIQLGEEIFHRPELGFKERRTAELVDRAMTEAGIPHRTGVALTGVVGTVAGRADEARVAVLGELDAVVCPGHPQADPITGAAHACGHNCQVATMLGTGFGLLDSGVMAELDGQVVLMAVPAEEYVEIEYRQRLREGGQIRFLGGKQEFIARGEFDRIDLAMMVHTGSPEPGKDATISGTSNGFIGKFIRYSGREAHAGGAPHRGVNALNAAMIGLVAIHAQRETFKDDDHIRVHPIITRGGDLVNIIPADVRMETYVRGKTMEAILEAGAKVNRALQAGGLAVGADCMITEIPGYLPRLNFEPFSQVFAANLAAIIGADRIGQERHGAGSTDMGDVSHLLPALHPMIGGAEGAAHSEDFRIADPELAYVLPAKVMAMTLVDLLADGAARAKELRAQHHAKYTRESYLTMWDSLFGGR